MLQPFSAADGAIVRVRVPGGRIPSGTLRGLFEVARRHGAPVIQLTSRGNLQIRCLPDPLPDSLTTEITGLGLLPSATHDRARTIVAAPLSADLDPMIRQLDQAVVSDSGLTQLPGRFLWAISDASGSVLGEPWDVAYQRLSPDDGLLLVPGHATRVAPRDAATAMVERARLFLEHRSDARVWNTRELPGGSPLFAGLEPHEAQAAPPLTPGVADQDLVAGVPLGLLEAHHVSALADLGSELVVTPWRSIVVREGAGSQQALQATGFTVGEGSAWNRLSACVGAPHCRRTTTPTLDLARQVAPRMTAAGLPLHIVGCGRSCGAPRGEHRTVVAPASAEDVLAPEG